ncbi:unnamed protein product [Heterosigma akashiwo]
MSASNLIKAAKQEKRDHLERTLRQEEDEEEITSKLMNKTSLGGGGSVLPDINMKKKL